MTVIEIVISILALIGGLLTLFNALGFIRLPDVYSRAHTAGKVATLGVISIMIAAFLYYAANGTFNFKILLSILFIFMTAPIASQVITRSAYKQGVPLEKKTIGDDLKDVYHTPKNADFKSHKHK